MRRECFGLEPNSEFWGTDVFLLGDPGLPCSGAQRFHSRLLVHVMGLSAAISPQQVRGLHRDLREEPAVGASQTLSREHDGNLCDFPQKAYRGKR